MTSTEIYEAWQASDQSETWEQWAYRHSVEFFRKGETKLAVFEDGGSYHFDGGCGQWYTAEEQDEIMAWMNEE